MFGKYYKSDLVESFVDCLYDKECVFLADDDETEVSLHQMSIDYWAIVSAAFANNPYVIGYDLLNEPSTMGHFNGTISEGL